MNGPEEQSQSISCAQCGEANAEGAAFCTQCGGALAAQGAAPRRHRTRAKGDAAERSRARQEFGRIKQTVLTVRAVFWSCALLAGVQVLAWHLVAAAEELEPAGTIGLLVTALLWGQLGLVVAGGIWVLRAPLVWTVVGACYWTLNSAVMLFASGGVPRPMDLAQAFLAVAFWFAVAQAARVQRMLAADPSLQLVRKRIDPSRRVEGGVGDEARARARQARRQAWQGRLRLLGVVAIVLVVAGFSIYRITRPPAVDATLAAFEERWRQHDVDGVCALFAAGADGSVAGALREELEQRGWLTALPRLGEAELTDRGDVVRARWSMGEQSIDALFERQRGGWLMQRVALPPIDAPDPDATISAFRQAWQTPGTAALVAMMRPASRERLGDTLRRLLERRDWHERRPELGAVDPGRVRSARTKVLFTIEHDELGVSLEYWHPQWYVVGVSLPRQ